MTSLRTTNRRAKRVMLRKAYREAFAFHEKRVARLIATDRLDKLRCSGFVRRGSTVRKARG